MTSTRVETPHGSARVDLHCAEEGRAWIMVGHGAGGGVDTPDLVALARAATAEDVHLALVEQPYRVAGRRAPAPAKQLDVAWLAVAEDLGRRWFSSLPVFFAGRSSGARVACRTAEAGAASGVLCLAFPAYPPRNPDKHRLAELDAVDVPMLVVQGERDTFGKPEPAHRREVVVVEGDHSLKRDADSISRAVREWLVRVLRFIA